MGSVAVYIFIFVLAEYTVLLNLMHSGALFQILAASLINVEVKIFPPCASFSRFVSAALVLLSGLVSFLLVHFVG